VCIWFGPSPPGDRGDLGRSFDTGCGAPVLDRDFDGWKLVSAMAEDRRYSAGATRPTAGFEAGRVRGLHSWADSVAQGHRVA
jgi:hypothetical protein